MDGVRSRCYIDNNNHYREKGERGVMKCKRWKLSVTGALLFLLLAAGCGGTTGKGMNETGESAQLGGAALTEQQANNDKATRVYKNMLGETEIPVYPKRIVSDWYYGDLVALGVKPIGLTSYVLNNHPYIAKEGTHDIGSTPNVEKVLELEPDLIILYGDSKQAETLSKIAPTIGLELFPDPFKSVRLFGELLGKEKEAEQWISRYNGKVEAAKKKIAGKVGSEETFTIFTVWRKELRVYGAINMGGYVMYNSLGLKPQQRVYADIISANKANAGYAISLEELASFAGDHIMLTVFDGEEQAAELKNSPIWKGLPAVKNGRVYEVDFNLLYNEDPVAMEHQLDLITDKIVSGQ